MASVRVVKRPLRIREDEYAVNERIDGLKPGEARALEVLGRATVIPEKTAEQIEAELAEYNARLAASIPKIKKRPAKKRSTKKD